MIALNDNLYVCRLYIYSSGNVYRQMQLPEPLFQFARYFFEYRLMIAMHTQLVNCFEGAQHQDCEASTLTTGLCISKYCKIGLIIKLDKLFEIVECLLGVLIPQPDRILFSKIS